MIEFTTKFTSMRIGLLSDTHGFLDENIASHLASCDEIWHAGDFGSMEVIDELRKLKKPLRGVYGNIDGQEIRAEFPLQIEFHFDKIKVLMRHIGGSPPKYNPDTKKELALHRPNLFISGHSHILKVMYDEKVQALHMNPGAAGRSGWHTMRTMLRFVIDGADIRECEVIELGRRGA